MLERPEARGRGSGYNRTTERKLLCYRSMRTIFPIKSLDTACSNLRVVLCVPFTRSSIFLSSDDVSSFVENIRKEGNNHREEQFVATLNKTAWNSLKMKLADGGE